jgi:hypothetical protein
VQPIIAAGETEFGMFSHFSRYPWVLSVREYDPTTLARFTEDIIGACEAAVGKLRIG